MIAPPPTLSDLRYGDKVKAGYGESTILADFDFETYSEVDLLEKGVVIYSEHPSTEILSLAYDLKDGKGARLWKPSDLERPLDLIQHVKEKKLLEAWNVAFEWYLWMNVCIPKYDFPILFPLFVRCAMAKARAYGLPGSLEQCALVLGTVAQKDKEGKRLIQKFSKPRKPTLSDKSTRNFPENYPEDAALLYAYNIQDIKVEAEISSLIPDLSEDEFNFWFHERRINRTGIGVDLQAVEDCIEIVDQAFEEYHTELRYLTKGVLTEASKLAQMKQYLKECHGLNMPDMQQETIDQTLKVLQDPVAKRILEIRNTLNSAAIKKLYALKNYTFEGRIYENSIYHAARTGRSTGVGAQLKNLPNSGLSLYLCICGIYHAKQECPECGHIAGDLLKEKWNINAAEQILFMTSFKSLGLLEFYYGDAFDAIAGCLRSMLISKKDYDLIASDYVSIEAIVLAVLADEKWRLDVFKTHGKIYEMSAAKITGIPFDEILAYKEENKEHHPSRKLGKVAELASGYQGYTGAWKKAGADLFLSEDQIKRSVDMWRQSSPNIVKLWKGLELAAKTAIQYPGTKQHYKLISYDVDLSKKHLYCTLPSGRILTYHEPKIVQGDFGDQIAFKGWNTNAAMGGIGWVTMYTYGGKLTENVTQAVARDILAYAIINCTKKGYIPVLEVYDEIVAEIQEGFGSVIEMEAIMGSLPPWAQGWPIKARDGWRGKRYRK